MYSMYINDLLLKVVKMTWIIYKCFRASGQPFDYNMHIYLPTYPTAFHEVFNLFDINGGGTIDADELDAALKAVDVQLTHEEITDVLHVIDEDGKPIGVKSSLDGRHT